MCTTNPILTRSIRSRFILRPPRNKFQPAQAQPLFPLTTSILHEYLQITPSNTSRHCISFSPQSLLANSIDLAWCDPSCRVLRLISSSPLIVCGSSGCFGNSYDFPALIRYFYTSTDKYGGLI